MTGRSAPLVAVLLIAGFANAKDLHWKDLPRYLNNKQVTIVDGKGIASARVAFVITFPRSTPR